MARAPAASSALFAGAVELTSPLVQPMNASADKSVATHAAPATLDVWPFVGRFEYEPASMRVTPWFMSVGLALAGCSSTPQESTEPSCAVLFGRPGPNTGLGAEMCRPSCVCAGAEFTPPDYGAGDIAALRARVLLNPPEIPSVDPYESPAPALSAGSVCAVLRDDAVAGGYTLQTFPSAKDAVDAGGEVTHEGACGLCSSLQDLAVYLETTDLTTPVRECGLLGVTEGDEASRACLEEVGFTPACSAIWFYNTRHTRKECLSSCLAQMNEPNQLPDGSLNECIQCDEDKSGPVFKAVSGRTRRNSGIPSALCRPCDSVSRVLHRYE